MSSMSNPGTSVLRNPAASSCCAGILWTLRRCMAKELGLLNERAQFPQQYVGEGFFLDLCLTQRSELDIMNIKRSRLGLKKHFIFPGPSAVRHQSSCKLRRSPSCILVYPLGSQYQDTKPNSVALRLSVRFFRGQPDFIGRWPTKGQ